MRSENDDRDNDADSSSVDTQDTLEDFVQFVSHRNDTGLEEAISITYPLPRHAAHPGTLRLSSLLEEEDLVPLFDGAGWAGTRVWAAAIWGLKYLVEEYGDQQLTLCELGCGLGMPGMVWHQMGNDVVLTDQTSILTQMLENTRSNFAQSFVETIQTATDIDRKELTSDENSSGKICAAPLSWSRSGFRHLLASTGHPNGFDIVLSCDCVYEPLYGKSWELLVEVIDECLKVNPSCIVVTSVERRNGDGIDLFRAKMEGSEQVSSVERVMRDEARDLELYITRGKI